MRIARGQIYVGDVPALEIARRFGTPLYVIDAAQVGARYAQFETKIAYRPLHIRYACKANANVALMRHLRGLGAQLDACSPGDLAFADAAGFQANEIFYTGSSVSDEELREVARRRIFLNADSLSQLDRYGKLNGPGVVGIRINTGVETGFHAHVRSGGPTSKFGIYPSQIEAACEIAWRRGLRIVGLHSHLGSDIFDVQPAIQALDALITLSTEMPDIELLDLGGGWGVPFMPGDPEFDMAEYGQAVTERMQALSRRRGRAIALHLEPGAYVVSDAGLLFMRVTELKPPIAIGESRTPYFAGTDSSYSHVVSTVLYDSYHALYVADRADHPATQTYDVVGNLMQAGDVLARGRTLPVLNEGDLLIMENCGAYAACRAPQFNERPRPGEVLVDGAEVRLVRRAESVGDLLAQQVW